MSVPKTKKYRVRVGCTVRKTVIMESDSSDAACSAAQDDAERGVMNFILNPGNDEYFIDDYPEIP